MLGRKGRSICCWPVLTWIKAIGWIQIIFFTLLSWRTAETASVIADNVLEQKRMSQLIEDLRYGSSKGSSTLMEHAVHFSRSALMEFQIPGWDRLNFFEQQSMWQVGVALFLMEIYSISGLIMGILLLTGASKKKLMFLGAWTIFAVISLIIFVLVTIVVIYLLATLVGVTRVLLFLVLAIVSIIWSIWVVHVFKKDLEKDAIPIGRCDEYDDEEGFRIQKNYRDPHRYI